MRPAGKCRPARSFATAPRNRRSAIRVFFRAFRFGISASGNLRIDLKCLGIDERRKAHSDCPTSKERPIETLGALGSLDSHPLDAASFENGFRSGNSRAKGDHLRFHRECLRASGLLSVPRSERRYTDNVPRRTMFHLEQTKIALPWVFSPTGPAGVQDPNLLNDKERWT